MSESAVPLLSVVVPVHNELENVAPLQAELEHCLRESRFELIFIDDGSTDGTALAIRASPHVRVLSFPVRRGQSAALHAGIWAARAAVIATLDGDLQNDPADIQRLVATMQNGADLVCGYREKRADGFLRRWQSEIANACRRLVLRDRVRDSACGLKVMRAECREALVLFAGMHRFLPALIGGAGHSVVEIQVTHRPRRHGTSKYGLGNRILPGLIDLFGVWWLLHRRRALGNPSQGREGNPRGA